jgi:hypothetical protein
MLHEYALEPALLDNWKDFRYFTEKFCVSRGRMIARYPKRWKRLVYESLSNCGEIERKRIEEGLIEFHLNSFTMGGHDLAPKTAHP